MIFKNKYLCANIILWISEWNKNYRCRKKHLWRVWRSHCVEHVWTCERWYTNFKRGNFNIENKSCFGQSTTVDDDSICAIVAANPRISTKEIAKSININNSTANWVNWITYWNLIVPVVGVVTHLLNKKNKMDYCFVANSLAD